jgi:hypothetical protein
MHNRFDQLGKHIGAAALDALGSVVTHAEISAETQYADLRFHSDPARGAGRARLGLLGRLVATPCLIELYSRPPRGAQLRACLAKHLAHWQQAIREGRMRRHGRSQAPPAAAPFLWLIAAGTPDSLLAELKLEPEPEWPAGVYLLGGDALRAGIIAGNQLPRERSTLLVRLMAAGTLLPDAIAELAALPADAYERAVADQILLRFRTELRQQPNPTHAEKEFLMTIYRTWDDARRTALKSGLKRGQLLERQNALLTVLQVRGIPVSAAERKRIRAEKDPDRLQRWLERAARARSLAKVLDERS